MRLAWKLLDLTEKFWGQNPNLKKKYGLILLFEVGGWMFLSPCYHAQHLQQIHWIQIFCKMYGLAVNLSVPTWTDLKNIDKISTNHSTGQFRIVYSLSNRMSKRHLSFKNTNFFVFPWITKKMLLKIEMPLQKYDRVRAKSSRHYICRWSTNFLMIVTYVTI